MTLCDSVRLTVDRMDAGKRLMLRRYKEMIIQDLEPNDILDELYTRKVLSLEDTEIIRSQTGRGCRVRCLLDILERRGCEGSYECLVEALRHDYSWLASKLEQRQPSNGIDNVDRSADDNDQAYHDALALGNVPRLPNLHVERREETKRVQEALAEMRRGDCVALCGMTNCGKSVVAAAAVRSRELLAEHFNMRVFWLGAGEAHSEPEAATLLHRLGRMINPGFTRETDSALMKVELSRTLASANYSNALIVLDDVCSQDVFNLFDLGCKLLVTTQYVDLVKGMRNGHVLNILSGFKLQESLELFSRCTEVDVDQLPGEARQIHELCKGAPLTIALLGSMMEPHKYEAGDVKRWRYYVDMIKDKKDRRRNKERNKDYLTNTIRHCLERLSAEMREHYKYFVLFPEDVNITSKTLEVVLGKSKYEVEDIMADLHNKSLIASAFNHELQCYVYGIHALLLGYLKAVVEKDELSNMHCQLLKSYVKAADGNYANLPNDNYIYTYMGHHLREADQLDDFPRLYFDLHFLAAKARAAGVVDLQFDLHHYKNYITRGLCSELVHRLEACERFVLDHGQQLCNTPFLDVVQLALLSADPEIRQLGESAAAASPHRLYMRMRTANDTISTAGGIGVACDEVPSTPALELGENVRAACFAHHAHLVLVGGADGRVRMWNHGYRSAEHEYHGHRDAAVRWLEVSPDQTRFLSLADDGQVKVWSLDEWSGTTGGTTCRDNGTSSDEYVPSPRLRQSMWLDMFEASGVAPGDRPSDTSRLFRLMDDSIVTAGFSRCGDSLLVVGSECGQVVVWNINTETIVFEKRQQKPVRACALAGNDRLVVFAVDDFVYVYDLESSEYLCHLRDEPDARQLLVAGADGTHGEDECVVVRSRRAFTMWRWRDNRDESGHLRLDEPTKTELARLDEPEEEYTCAAVTWDGLYLIAGTSSGALLMWNLGAGAGARAVRELAPPGAASALCLDTFLDEESNSNVVYVLLSGGGDGCVRRWHVSPGLTEQTDNVNGGVARDDNTRLTGMFSARWMDSGAPLIAAATDDSRVRVYVGCSLVAEALNSTQQPTCLAVSPDGRNVAIGFAGGLVHLFQYRTKHQRPVMHLAGDVAYLEYVLGGSSGDSVLVAATDDGCIMSVVSSGDGRCVRLQRGGGIGLVMSMRVLAGLVTVALDGCVKSWELNEGELSDVLVAANPTGTGAPVTAACTSIRRDRVCMVCADGRVRLYTLNESDNPPTVKCMFQHERRLGESPLTACCWSSDSRHLAAGSRDGCVYVLHVHAGGDTSVLARLTAHRDAVRWLTWSPPPGGGAPLVLASAGDNLVVWWDVSKVGEHATTGGGARRRSAARRSRPEPLDLTTIGPPLPQLMSDPVWCGKRGMPDKQELLGALPLTGNTVRHVSPSPDFTSFVTVDSSGVLRVLSILGSGETTPSPVEPQNSPT